MNRRYVGLYALAMAGLSFPLFKKPGFSGCGKDAKSCDVAVQTGCDAGQVCENVTDGKTACFAPLVVKGRVFDLSDSAAIEGAKIVALDVTGAPISVVALSDASGGYELIVPTERNEDGTPAGNDFILSVDATGFQSFPSDISQAVPIDTSNPTIEGDQMIIDSSLTDIGLVALQGAGTTSI